MTRSSDPANVVLVFVHGTGVREDRHEALLGTICGNMGLSEDRVVRCYWGGTSGSRSPSRWLSVPEESISVKETDVPTVGSVAMWLYLDFDPLIELSLLKETESDGRPHSSHFVDAERVIDRLTRIASKELLPSPKLPLGDLLADAAARILQSGYGAGLVGDDVDDYAKAIARAIVAHAWHDAPPSLAYLDSRDLLEVASQVSEHLLPTARRFGDRFLAFVRNAGIYYASGLVRRRRPFMTSHASAPVGDILVYQARGAAVRDAVRLGVLEASERADVIGSAGLPRPTVLLLGHSLGGVAAFDLMVLDDVRRKVGLLVTVGSQVPLLYEMNALVSLEFREHRPVLPEGFPRWRNVYDRGDFLSYVADGLFGEGIDKEIRGGSRFPESHSEYWDNPALYEYVESHLP